MTLEQRVFGPPGTGKTTFLSRQIAIEAERHGAESVLVASFTKAAATELRGRDLPIPEGNVGTLHSLCYRSMGCPTVAETRKGFRQWNDWLSDRINAGTTPKESSCFAMGEGKRDRDPDDPYEDEHDAAGDEEVNGNVFLKALNFCRAKKLEPGSILWDTCCARLFNVSSITGSGKETIGFMNLWKEFKQETGMIDFADMIDHGRFCDPPNGARVLMFDECQDFSASELSVIRNWEEKSEITILGGDDDQAIYGFRGATPDAFLDPPIPQEQKRILSQSYRLPRAVKSISEDWIRLLSRREPKEFRPRDADGDLEVISNANWHSTSTIIDIIEDEISNGRSVMVLALCSYMIGSAGGVIHALRREGIPFHNQYRQKRNDWNPLRHGAKRLLSYIKQPDRLWTWEELDDWIELIDSKKTGLRRGAKKAIHAMSIEPERKNLVVGKDDLAVLFNGWESAQRWLTGSTELLLENAMNPEKEKQIQYPIQVLKTRGVKALQETPKCCVGTVHSVKGGQADVVILFSDISGSALEELKSGEEGIDSVRRAFYVGMTRAKEKLYVTRPYIKKFSMRLDSFVEG